MDPEATLKRIDDFLRAGETGEEVDEWCESLMEWLARGGFEPDWEKYPLGASYYRCRAIQAARAR